MKLSRVFAAAAIAVTCSLTSGQAQTLRDGVVPAEFPPASYTGRQYVDSRGCVFIRAGVDGNVTWVPRVSRSRKVICGFQPSIARARPSSKPEAPAASDEPVIAPVVQSQPNQRTAQSRTGAKPVATTPRSSVQVVRSAPSPKPRRIGVSVPRQQPVLMVQKSAARTIVAPKHVYENQRSSTRGIHVPAGYKPAWDDDRLNTKRAHQTFAGKDKMDRVWTQTVPRTLIIVEATEVVRQSKNSKPMVTVSTRSNARGDVKNPASHRYVQAGLFTTDAKAQAAAKRLAKWGVAARLGTVKHKGKSYRAVVSGPHKTQAALTAALRKVQSAGYTGATLRK